MEIYTMTIQSNPCGEFILLMLGIGVDYKIKRFRDAWLRTDEEGKLRVYVLLRCGGDNYRELSKNMHKSLRSHPDYRRDWDDSFDETYATYEFSIPKGMESAFYELVKQGAVWHQHPVKKLKWISDHPESEEFKILTKKMMPIVEGIQKAFENGATTRTAFGDDIGELTEDE